MNLTLAYVGISTRDLNDFNSTSADELFHNKAKEMQESSAHCSEIESEKYEN